MLREGLKNNLIMKLIILSTELNIFRFSPELELPEIAGDFFSITKTPEEISVVTSDSEMNGYEKVDKGWKVFKVQGPLDFSLTGILSSLSTPLAEMGISIFAISTFDTDYILVKAETLESARIVFEKNGHEVVYE